MDILGLNAAISKALASVPGLEKGLGDQIQAAIAAEIAGLQTLEDPVLQRFDALIAEVRQIREMVLKFQGIRVDWKS